jgi:hypothetical protein
MPVEYTGECGGCGEAKFLTTDFNPGQSRKQPDPEKWLRCGRCGTVTPLERKPHSAHGPEFD